MNYRLDEGAQGDLDEAVVYYEERRPGLGWRFLEVVADALTTLGEQPDLGQEVEGDEGRRWVLAGFPYLLYYRVTDEIVVEALVHASRELRRR